MNKANNPIYPSIRIRESGKRTTRVAKPNLLTILDATKSWKERNCWTYDLNVGTDGVKGILVSTWAAIGRGSFHPSAAYQKTGKTKGQPVDFNNGNNHTSPGMKVFGRKRQFKRQINSSIRALYIYGVEPWNSREAKRGAIAHETGANRYRGVSFGCLATYGKVLSPVNSVHFHAWEIWKDGSWLYVYTGHSDESVASNIWWKKNGGNALGENRATWDYNE